MTNGHAGVRRSPHRLETTEGALVGTTFQTDIYDPVRTVMALTLVDKEQATPGTQVEVVWGQHPGAGTPPDADLGFPRDEGDGGGGSYNEVSRTVYRDKA